MYKCIKFVDICSLLLRPSYADLPSEVCQPLHRTINCRVKSAQTASSNGRSRQCETSSGSRPQQHRSYESVRRHLFLQAPYTVYSGPGVQYRNDSAETAVLRKVKARLSDWWGKPLSGRELPTGADIQRSPQEHLTSVGSRGGRTKVNVVPYSWA